MQFNSLTKPKVYFLRNKNKSCYIAISYTETIINVIVGICELEITIGNYSFLVYEVSSDLDSFTDNVNRLIYIDKYGIYIVSKKENSIETIVKKYSEEGILRFEGLIITVSALNGAITLYNQILSFKHFYNVYNESKKGNFSHITLSETQPYKEQILRNFYNSFIGNCFYNRKTINNIINYYTKSKKLKQ